MFDDATLRARFKELEAKRKAIRAVVDPMREKRDAMVSKAQEAERKADAELRDASKGLAEIENEIGNIRRALNGRTGEPTPAATEDPAAGEA